MANKVINPESYALKRKMVNILVYILLTVLAVIWVMPLVWIALQSFRAGRGAYVASLFPSSYTIDNYVALFRDTNNLNFPRAFMNTFIVAVFSCIISVFFTLSVSFCFSRLRFKWRTRYMNLFMILGLFPGFMAMLATYFILKALGLTQGDLIKVALVLVYSASTGMGFTISKGFFDTIPKALDEAAYVDGATRWQVFTKITIPLSKPILVYTALQAFMAPWIDFVFAKVICGANQDQYTVALTMWNMLEREYIDTWFVRFAAAAVLVSIPISIMFIKMQGFYTNGMGGAVKG
ncbi:ABC transporter permease subunit [Erysipelotrichaceae bacterium 51-3]